MSRACSRSIRQSLRVSQVAWLKKWAGVVYGVRSAQEPTAGRRRLDGGPFRQLSAGTIQKQVEEDHERVSVLLAGEARENIRIKPSGALFFGIHTSS